jgi:hypothetical protein
MKFVATKTIEQLDMQALHRVRERLVVPALSIRSAPSSWTVASRCAKGCDCCGRSKEVASHCIQRGTTASVVTRRSPRAAVDE